MANPFKKEETFSDQLRRIVMSHASKGQHTIGQEPEDILTFLKNAGMQPTPVQAFVLKLIYKLPLEDSTKVIEVWDRFRENLQDTLTEVEFFYYLVEQELINLTEPDQHLGDDVNIWNIVLAWGRRGGKTAISGFICAYEVYLLLHLWSPHDWFGVIETEEIRVMSISTTKDNAKFVRNYAIGCIDGHPFFRPYVLHDSQERITFRTQKMIDRGVTDEELKDRPGVVLATYPANQRIVRGAGNIVIVYDELAHYIRAEGSVTGDETVVNAASPSQARFHKDCGDGRGDRMYSKTISISDPLDEAGVFHREWERGFKWKDPAYLTLRLPTVLANPVAVTSAFLYDQKEKMTEREFQAAYEAQFVLGVTSFIESMKWLEDAFEDDRSFHLRGHRGIWYYCGIDLGFERDKTAISVVHRTNTGQIVQDYLKVFPGGTFEHETEQYDAVLEILEAVYHEFAPREVITDQFEGRGIVHAASRFGLKITLEHITQLKHSEMAKLFRTYLRSGKFKTSAVDGLSFRDELISLRKEDKGQGVIRVQKTQGGYDDEFDATIRSVWAAAKEEKTNRGLETVERERGLTIGSTAHMAKARPVIPGQSTFRQRARNNGLNRRGNRWGQ